MSARRACRGLGVVVCRLANRPAGIECRRTSSAGTSTSYESGKPSNLPWHRGSHAARLPPHPLSVWWARCYGGGGTGPSASDDDGIDPADGAEVTLPDHLAALALHPRLGQALAVLREESDEDASARIDRLVDYGVVSPTEMDVLVNIHLQDASTIAQSLA